jgi:hypothetical protein
VTPRKANPKPGYKSDKLWRDAIMRAVHRQIAKGGGKYLDTLANKLVKCALEGDIQAMKEIGDRLDGRAAQSLSVSGADGGALTVRIVD